MRGDTEQMMTCEQRFFLDKNISLKAKGLYCVLKSIEKPFTMDDIIKATSSGSFAIRSAFNELIDSGYISRNTVRENGRIVGFVYKLTKPKKD